MRSQPSPVCPSRSRSWPRLRRGAIGAAVAIAGAAAAGCSSGGSGDGTGAALPRVKVYSLEGHRFTAAFPSRPAPEVNPPVFSPANGLPAGTAAAGLDVGQLGSSSRNHSFGVIVAELPASSSANLLAAWFRALAEGLQPTHIGGHLAVRHISIVRQGSSTYFGGFELLQDRRAFFVLGAYDSSLAAVNHFLESFSIRS